MNSPASPMSNELDRILEKYTSQKRPNDAIKGAAFVVTAKEGKFRYSGSAGQLNFTTKDAFTTDTVCEIGSLTKLVTATAVLQLLEQGLLGLDQDLGEIVPELSNRDVLQNFTQSGQAVFSKQEKPMTVETLLTHTSGFGYDVFDPDLVRWRALSKDKVDWNSFSREALDIPLKFQPGEGWVYGIGLDWAGVLIERLTDTSLEGYMRENIFAPLGMNSTTFRPEAHPELEEHRAQVGLRTETGNALTAGGPMKGFTSNLDCGGVGLLSTAADYGKLLSAILNGGGGILSSEGVSKLLIPRIENTSDLESNLYGPMQHIFAPEYPTGLPVNFTFAGAMNLEDIAGKRKKGSVMWSGITNTRWWLDPESGIAAVLMVQVLPPGDHIVASLCDELERAVYGN